MKGFKNINEILLMKEAHNKDGRHLTANDFDLLNDAAIVFDDKIRWVGKSSEIPKEYKDITFEDLSGHVLTPEVVDSHTHLVFGGNRANEYSMRLNGEDYQKIAQAGGGILATQKATLELTEDQLFELACQRVDRVHSYGVGTIEVKSGYALDFEGEKKLSRVIHRLKEKYSPKVNIFNTYLAAHAVPKGKTSEQYLAEVVIPLMKELSKKNIIDAVDIFHEEGYFNEQDTRKLFDEALNLNLAIKIHADEFNDNNGAAIACEYKALSCDHLLRTSDSGIEKLSQSSTVATFLPGTAFFLGKEQVDAQKFLKAGAKVAIASDYNPGSCHCDNLILLASFAATQYKMNMTQLWSAITLNAAHALGKKQQGAIITGLDARFSLFKTNSISEITYSWGKNLAVK